MSRVVNPPGVACGSEGVPLGRMVPATHVYTSGRCIDVAGVVRDATGTRMNKASTTIDRTTTNRRI